MTNFGKLQITTPSDREIAMTRVFDAPRGMVWDAFTKPELIKRWLGVRAGWTMPVCEVDLKVGGKYRYVWRGPKGNEMGMGGVFREIKRPERMVATEKFDEAWYPGDAMDTQTFVEKGGKTTVTTAVLYASK
ncbi:MAG TPA: SRPBCC domain-containing protein, partial [Gemmatimonadaceae bacterium]